MNLHVALCHAMTSISTADLATEDVEVTFVGTINVQGEGARKRRIGPVTISSDVAAGLISAVRSGDDLVASQQFEEAFASSYGVTDVQIHAVGQLEITPTTNGSQSQRSD